MGIKALIREFIREMQDTRGPKPYDTIAEVNRVEDGKAWVKIPGGVPETPADLMVNAEKGDTVSVKLSGGKAWVSGNKTQPPTGDKVAKEARKLAVRAAKKAADALNEADKLVIITNEQGEEIRAVIVTANGKNKTYHQSEEPTEGEYAEGDVWFDTDDDNKMYRWDGDSWEAVTLGDDAIASLSASKLTAGSIDARQITVSNLDAGNITSGYLAAARIQAGSLSISKTDGLQTALDDKADTDDAVLEEQLIYISKASGTSSVSGTTTWVTESGDVQNTWTTKRPTYNSSYPVLFVARQTKRVDGSIKCTTPVKDDTTTVIDGGHITTGTIDANVVTVTHLDAGNITSGYLAAARIQAGSLSISKTSGLQTALDGKASADGVILRNLVTNGYWDPDFSSSLSGWSKESSAVMTYDESTGLWKISCSSSYFGLTQAISVEANTDYVISAEVGTTFNLGFGNGSYPQYSGSWQTAGDGRKYRVVNSGSYTTLNVYAYATSSVPCYINRIKVEKGSTYTGWSAGAHEVEIASGIAGDYLTNISGYTGICVHNANDLANFLNINSGEIGIYLNSTKVASYGATSASLGEGSSSASIGLCGDTFHLTGRQYDNYGANAGVLCLDNDSTSSNKVMSISTLTQSQEASWFSTSGTIPNQNFAAITASRNSSMGIVSIMARKASGKLSAINILPTEIHLLPAGTVSGSSVTSSGIILTASKCECSPDFLSYGKVGTVYGYDNPVSTSINVHITENGYLYRTTASSRKIKKEISDIIEDDLDPDRLYDLPVRQFKYRKNRLSEDDMRYEAFMPGFIAEEVAEVYPIAADLDSKGEPEDWNVRCILPPMLALIQRQKREIADLNARVEVIEGRKAC